ncbi:MAG: hypothetical protein HYV35_01295 [Lentisphaerae bacterium]|nr:hypothetical protein [Lentisphaerota bacterium]
MKIIVTAGPTREALDPVRFLSNRSSGKMGYALAHAAARRGHKVTLISGPVALTPPAKATFISITTAAEMFSAVKHRLPRNDALIMAAAVADWRPSRFSPRKLKKTNKPWRLRLEPTPDILMSLRPRKGRWIFIGFAAETDHLLKKARAKLVAKGLDLIVANNVSQRGSGFEVNTNRVTLIARDGRVQALPLMAKTEVAARILDWLEARFAR